MVNNTSFTTEMTTFLKREYKKYTDDPTIMLKYYQFLTRTAFASSDRYSRGLLAYHSMGMGKTFLAIGIALANLQKWRPIIIASKSLHNNFSKSLDKYSEITGKAIDQNQFKYVSADAYNASDQLIRAVAGKDALMGGLEGTLLIIDEAHNFFRSIISSPNEESNARRIYHMIMGTKSIRLLFLTGTPCSKDPLELVACCNMLVGYELLPSKYDSFYNLYVDGQTMKNRDYFMNRILGLVSYASSDLTKLFNEKGADESSEMPTKLPIKIEYVAMSKIQYQAYRIARDKEEATRLRQLKYGKKTNSSSLSLPNSEKSTYYVESRQLSNFAEESSKIKRLIENVKKSPGPVIIYSQFVQDGGLKAVVNMLEKYADYSLLGTLTKGKKYAIISGEVSQDERLRLQGVWNNIDNKYGDQLHALLISKTGAEGLDLKYGRQAHILEPYWDKAREEQVYARIIRLGSHRDLPPSERNVQPFLYISTPHMKTYNEIPEEVREEMTVDELFHSRALKKWKLNEAFREALRECAIECAFYKSTVAPDINCRICLPTGVKLYSTDPENDIHLDNPCLPFIEQTEKMKTIMFDGNKYFYREVDEDLGYRFYQWNEDLQLNMQIMANSDEYTKLVLKLQP